MKKILLLLCCVAACALNKTLCAAEVKQDGLSAETAAIIIAKDEKEGPLKEVEWIQKNYPESKILRFVTRPSKNNKVYDVFFIKTKDAKSLQLFLEVSSFYHKT